VSTRPEFGSDFPGGLAEYVAVPAANLEPVPEHLDMTTAAAWPSSFTTAWRMLVTGGSLQPSETARFSAPVVASDMPFSN